jgi:hypothetical protein
MSDDALELHLESPGTAAAVAGLTAGLVVGPLALAAAVPAADAATLYVGVLAAAVGSALVGWLTLGERAEAALARVGRTPAAWGLVFVGAPAALAVPLAGDVGAVLMVPGIGGGAVCGLVLAVMARNRAARERFGGATVAARFDATWASDRRRRAVAAGGAVAALGVLAMTVGFLRGPRPLGYVGQLVAPVALSALAATGERSYAVTGRGLVATGPGVARGRRWDDYEAFALADSELRLSRPRWTARLDVASIDPAELRAALAGHLPEREP